MSDIGSLVRQLGGMAQKQQLVARGARDIDLTRAVRRREVSRVRNGWYTTLPADDPAVLAVRVGGRLTGISAVARAGGWVLGSHPLHVSVPANAARLRSARNRFVSMNFPTPRSVVVHWDDVDLSDRGSVVAVGIADALARFVLDEPAEMAIAALDWALRTSAIDEIDLAGIRRRLPRAKQSVVDRADDRCDSLPESLARTRLISRGHDVVSQVPLGDSYRIDLVIDGTIALEVDGAEHHADRFELDRAKDLTITVAGLVALRASANMVFRGWGQVELAIETALAARQHVPLSEIQDQAVQRGDAPASRLVPRHRRRGRS